MDSTIENQIKSVVASKDDRAIVDFLKSRSWTLPTISFLFCHISDESIREEYLNSLDRALRIHIEDYYIAFYGDEEKKKNWRDKIVYIKSVAELDEKGLSQLPDDCMIRIVGDYSSSWQRELYTKETYAQIIAELNRTLDGITLPKENDFESELETFNEVCERLSEIEYDEEAERIGKASRFFGDPILEVSAVNLEGAVLKKRSLCEGLAETLRNALALKGIEARFIKGINDKTKTAHGWNQVRIGGIWFNVDFTWDLENVRRMIKDKKPLGAFLLMSDAEFKHEQYSIKRPEGKEKCTTIAREVLKNLKNRKDTDEVEM